MAEPSSARSQAATQRSTGPHRCITAHRGVLVIHGPIGPADVPLMCELARHLAGGEERDPLICDVAALVAADLGTVDALARLAVAARKLGCDIRLQGTGPVLSELLEFVGLAEVLPSGDDSGREPGR